MVNVSWRTKKILLYAGLSGVIGALTAHISLQLWSGQEGWDIFAPYPDHSQKGQCGVDCYGLDVSSGLLCAGITSLLCSNGCYLNRGNRQLGNRDNLEDDLFVPLHSSVL